MYFHDGIYELCWTYKIFYKKSKQLFIYDFIEINFFTDHLQESLQNHMKYQGQDRISV